MILNIDVTVTAPDQVLTGSVAVTVNVPPGAASPSMTTEAATAPGAPAPAADPNAHIQQQSHGMRWAGR